MKRIITLALLAGIATVAIGQTHPPVARYVPATPDIAHVFVMDSAHILSPPTIAALQDSALALQAETHADIAWVTLPTLGGRPIEEAALYIGRTWRVGPVGQPGDPLRNRGLVVLYVPDKTKTAGPNFRVEVGNGLEGTITDSRSRQISAAMREDLRAKRYDDAYVKGWNAAAALVREDFAGSAHPVAPAVAPNVARQPVPTRAPLSPSYFVIVAIVLVLGVLALLMLASRRAARKSPTMKFQRRVATTRDDDDEDDAMRRGLWTIIGAALSSGASGGSGGSSGSSDSGSSSSGGDFGGGGGFSGGGSSDTI